MPLQTWLGLIVCNLVWSAHPAMGKLVLIDFTPSQGAWLRYASALAAFVLATPVFRVVFRVRQSFVSNASSKSWLLIAFLGFMTFCFSPLTQMTGLNASRATENSLIIAMEPLLAVILAWIILKERVGLSQLLAFGGAVAGFVLLSGAVGTVTSSGHLVGNLILFASLLGEASYSVLGRKLIRQYPPLALFGTSLIFGVVFLTFASLVFGEFGAEIFRFWEKLSWRSAFGLFWLGPLGTMATYVYWMFALSRASVASLSMTLFIQPLVGALWGYLFLQERLVGWQWAGAVMILTAVFAQGWIELRRRST